MSTVLIIDDSRTIRKKVRRCLEEASLFDRYLEASNGLEGIQCVLQEPVDLVICDLMMPQMDGVRFLEFLRTNGLLDRILVIMLTSRGSIPDLVRTLDLGAVDFIPKPFHPEELRARVRVMLRIKHLQDELRARMKELEETSMRDPLTGLYNRRYLCEALARELNRARRFGLKVSVLLLDMDHFKEINDSYGHQRGDEILKELANLIRSMLRGYDFAARYGGDEFVIILSQNTVLGARIVAERLRRTVAENPRLRELAGGHPVTISVGVATYPDDVEGEASVDALIVAADQALYEAKRMGRNQVALGVASHG